MTTLTSLGCREVQNRKINGEELLEYLDELKGWSLDGDVSIHKIFDFDSFKEAVQFVHSVAEVAESENHHPDISVQFSKVTLRLSTHSERGLTLYDFIVAAKIDTLV